MWVEDMYHSVDLIYGRIWCPPKCILTLTQTLSAGHVRKYLVLGSWSKYRVSRLVRFYKRGFIIGRKSKYYNISKIFLTSIDNSHNSFIFMQFLAKFYLHLKFINPS